MIIKNLIIGMDKFGNKLQCGDRISIGETYGINQRETI